MNGKSYLEMNKEFVRFYKSMGYFAIPLYNYKEFAEDLMDYDGYSKYAKKFNLKQSDILAIMKVITESAAYQRLSQKSMMSTKSSTIIPPENTEEFKDRFRDSEALIQTRQTHVREVADIARIISNALGLNADYSYLIGLTHDIGHTWNGHVGERILSSIGRLNNSGYIVHNAMGAYIVERENIIDRAVQEVKQFNPKAKEEDIKEFMRYVIDGVVSHNGEGVIGKVVPNEKTAEEMAEEIRRCFTEKGFDRKITPATMEGAVIRYADIIAYIRSDILDGFRLKDTNGNKIMNEFDDEYLSIIGTVLARNDNFTKLLKLENKFLLEMYGLSKRIDKLTVEAITAEEKLELERTRKEREMIEAKYKEFEKYKIKYAKEYIRGIKPQSEVKTVVTQMMQNVFIKDLVEASKEAIKKASEKGSKHEPCITMTPLIRKKFFELRDLNVRKIVPYTRRVFEGQELPIAANELVNDFTDVLVETGIAYKLIPESAKSLARSKFTEEENKDKRAEIEKSEKMSYERKLCHYYTKQNPQNLEYIYTSVLEAMQDIAKHDIAIALGEERYDGELKETYMATKINPLKRKIAMMGRNSETMTPEDKERLLQLVLKDRKKDIERAVASKMAIEYVGGMTDNTILSVLIDKNLISRKQLIEGYGREEPGKQAEDEGVRKLQKAFGANEQMIYPDDKKDDEIRL